MSLKKHCMYIAAACSMAVCLASAHGQEPASGFQHIEGLTPFVGFWQADSDSSEVGSFSLSARWTGNKSYLQLQFSGTLQDERVNFGTIVVGQDVASDKLMLWGFWPDQQASGEATVGDNKLSWKSSGHSAQGETSAEGVMSISGDEMTISVTNVRRGGEDRPDMTITLKKRERRGRRQ